MSQGKPLQFASWILALLCGLVFLGLFETIIYFKKSDVAKEAELNALSYVSSISARFDREINELIFISSGLHAYIKVRDGKLDENEMNAILVELHNKSTNIRNLGVAVGTKLEYVVPYKGNEKAKGLDYRSNLEQWPGVKKIIDSGEGRLVGPINLVQGGKALIYRFPVYVNETYWGLLSTVVDLERLVGIVFSDLSKEDEEYQLAIRTESHGTEPIYGDLSLFDNPVVLMQKVAVPGGFWEFGVEPIQNESSLKLITIFTWLGRFLSVVILMAAFYLNRLRINHKAASIVLKDLNSTKDLFFSIIAHDLKNPFNGIAGVLEMLHENYDMFTEEKRRQILKSAHKSAENTKRLLDNLLTWAMSQSKLLSFNPQPLSVEEVLGDVVSFLEERFQSKEVALVTKIDTEDYLVADNDMLQTILRNLLANALKFTPRKGVVEIQVRGDHGFVEITVKDNGVGMSKKLKDGLFKLGKTRSHDGTENEKGTGLGLILCHDFTIKNKGKIEVKSELGKGSEFILSFPKV